MSDSLIDLLCQEPFVKQIFSVVDEVLGPASADDTCFHELTRGVFLKELVMLHRRNKILDYELNALFHVVDTVATGIVDQVTVPHWIFAQY